MDRRAPLRTPAAVVAPLGCLLREISKHRLNEQLRNRVLEALAQARIGETRGQILLKGKGHPLLGIGITSHGGEASANALGACAVVRMSLPGDWWT